VTGVRKSLLLSLADSYLGVVLQLAGTVIVSRLLTPAEVGVFAIAAVFTALAGTFRDFGVAEYLIQERELSADKLRAAFALNVIVSWLMGLLLVAGASFAAGFYGEPGVAHVMYIQALTFLILPFGAISMAWFRRELNYTPIIIGNVLSSIAGFAVVVTLATLGFGYMSLAWSSLASIVVVVLAAVWFRPSTFPRWPALRGIAQVFKFSKFASAIYIVSQFGRGAPELIIGRVRGVADVGLFSRAYGLVEIFNRLVIRPLMQVCMPYFAMHDRQHGSVASAYTVSVSMLTALGWPFLGCTGVMAFVAIRIIYGQQWLAAVHLAQILCLAGAIELIFLLAREALLARGQARRASAMQMQIVALQVLGLSAVVPFGLPGACWGLVAAASASVALSAWHLRAVEVGVAALVSGCTSSLALAAVTAGPLAVAAFFVPPDETNYLRWGLAGSAFAVVSWLVTLRLMRHRLWDELASVIKRSLRGMHRTA